MPLKRDLTIYFDLTTSVSWGGAPVGITRVEREIARRAAGRTAYELRYCFFHQATESYYELQPGFAAQVLASEAWVDLETMRSLPLDIVDLEVSDIGDLVTDERPIPSILALRERASALSLADVLELRASNPVVPVNTADGRTLKAVGQLIRKRIKLNPSVLVVNGGLDWEHKNLRRIRQIKKETGFLYIAIIYDIIPLIYPQYVVSFYVDLLKKYFGELFWTADFGLCISATTRKDVEKHLAQWRMPILPMTDWPLGCDIEGAGSLSDAPLPSAIEGRPFLLYVSTIEPRKSHRTIVEAFEFGTRTGRISNDAICVFVGRVGWNSENLIHEIRTNPVLADRILILSGISDEDLVSLYRAARFVVFPSRYEGYGLALVEAMALGKACISGDAGSLREVGGDAPLYIDPIELPHWVDALAQAFEDDAMIADLENRSRTRYAPVSWDDSADLFYAALDKWIGERS